MKVLSFAASGFSCNTYLCVDEESGRSVLIDPGTSAEEALAFLAGRKPEKILLTHGHFDHALCAEKLREETGALVCAHARERDLLLDPEKNASVLFGFDALSLKADVWFSDGDTVELGKSRLCVVHTPGHSPGGVCYSAPSVLFCGDTLFADGYGRTDLYGGSFETLRASVLRITEFAGHTTVYPGHGGEFVLSRRIAQIARELNV